MKGGELKVRSTGHRVVAITVIAVLNAAWFFTIGCAALCAFAACPQQAQHRQDSEEQCHHKGQLPTPQRNDSDHHSPCPDHNFFMASVVLPATPDVTPGLQKGSKWVGLGYFHRSMTARLVPLRDALTHSPPGLSSGRILLQKESLLRI